MIVDSALQKSQLRRLIARAIRRARNLFERSSGKNQYSIRRDRGPFTRNSASRRKGVFTPGGGAGGYTRLVPGSTGKGMFPAGRDPVDEVRDIRVDPRPKERDEKSDWLR